MPRQDDDREEMGEQEEYFLRVTMVSGRYGRKRSYQSTTFEQNFSEHAAQIDTMQQIFPAVGAAVGGGMVQVGEDGKQILSGG